MTRKENPNGLINEVGFSKTTLAVHATRMLFAITVDDKCGFIDEDGDVRIEPQYRSAGPFSGGLAKALSEGGEWGYINPQNKMVIPHAFDDAGDFHDGRAAICIEGKWGVINQDGDPVTALVYDHMLGFHQKLGLTRVGALYGYLDLDGDWAIPPQFSLAWHFNEDLAPACLPEFLGADGPSGYIAPSGRFAVPSDFRICNPFSGGIASALRLDNRFCLIDRKGRTVAEPKCDWLGDVSENLIPFRTRKWCGYVSTRGEIKIPAEWAEGAGFSQGLAAVKKSNDWGYIRNDGNYQIHPSFSHAESFQNGLASVVLGEKAAYINRAGEVVWQET